jgi:hypothetical protein
MASVRKVWMGVCLFLCVLGGRVGFVAGEVGGAGGGLGVDDEGIDEAILMSCQLL